MSVKVDISTIRRRVAAKLAHMTQEQARDLGEQMRVNDGKGPTMDNRFVRDLTGGYCSQSIDYWVKRRVAIRAGLLPRSAL